MKFSNLVDYLAQLEATSKRLEMTRILGELIQKCRSGRYGSDCVSDAGTSCARL